MKKPVLVLLFFLPAMLWAQSGFEGTWRFTPQSGQFGGKPDKFSLQNGMYQCETCVPKIDVQADGKDHPRTGSPYSDAISVRVVDDRTIESVAKKNGKIVGTSKDTVSEDGKTLTTEWSFVSQSGQKGSGKTISTRVAAGPAGAHKASGTWQPQELESASDSIIGGDVQSDRWWPEHERPHWRFLCR